MGAKNLDFANAAIMVIGVFRTLLLGRHVKILAGVIIGSFGIYGIVSVLT